MIVGTGSEVTFFSMKDTPMVPTGTSRTMLVAWKFKKKPGYHVGTLAYLNQMLLQADDCICDTEEPVCEGGDGCSVTGWYEDKENSEYDNFYTKANLNNERAEAISWAILPDFIPRMVQA